MRVFRKTIPRLAKWYRKIPRLTKIGLLGVVLIYISVAGTVSATTPWLARGDTRQHIDYTWRLYHGDIPKWSDGLKYPPFVKIYGHKPEAASTNPPFFYLIHAPFIGPLLDKGEWNKAIAVGRVINILLGVGCIFALAWAGWVFGGKRKELLAIAVPAIAVLTYRFTRLNVDYALDVLLVLLGTLSLVLDYRLLQNGLKKKNLILLGLISIAGMATKAPYIVFLFVSSLAILLAELSHGGKDLRKKILRGFLAVSTLFGVILLLVGWFYWRNYKYNGGLFSPFPPGYTGGRSVQSLSDVLSNKKIWQLFYLDFSSYASLSLVISSFALAGWLNIGKDRIYKFLKIPINMAAILLMALIVIGIFLTQISHAVGIGSINFRYMLPAILPISLFLSVGLLSFKHARGQLVTLAVLGMGTSSVLVVSQSKIHLLYSAAWQNGLPSIILTALGLLFILGAVLLSVSLFTLTKNQKTI